MRDDESRRRLSASTLRRLEIQGMTASAGDIASIYPWHRLTFAICSLIAVAATATASRPLFLVLATVAVIGAVGPVHPFDLIYNLGIRHLRGTGPLPRRGAPTRFACGTAAIWLAATVWVLGKGLIAMGVGLGAGLAIMAILVATTDVCIPSMVYRGLFSPLPPKPENL